LVLKKKTKNGPTTIATAIATIVRTSKPQQGNLAFSILNPFYFLAIGCLF